MAVENDGTGGGIWQSTDSGGTWSQLVTLTQKWGAISVSPDFTKQLAVVTDGNLWQSTDSGACMDGETQPVLRGQLDGAIK